jgi:translation initiation factor IF-2
MLQNRPPIIVILGHVDHGKTTLLDYLRKSNVAAREAGGITQNISSFQVQTKADNLFTFIDTPGHAAFSQMRSRGSKIADIALLIISGTDGIMPQTKQSIDFINASKIPYIVTITKSDLPGYDADKVKTQLTDMGVVVEDFGGPVPAVNVSAKTGEGIPELLDVISLVSSLNPPRSDVSGVLDLVVLESRMDSKKGPVAVVLVKNGTLKIGQELFQKESVGKVRAIISSAGSSEQQALPSAPVELLGLTKIPEVGSQISSAPLTAAKAPAASVPVGAVEGKLNVILRTDVAGSLEAILASFTPEINVVSSGTGDVTENDIMLAKVSRARVLCFNVRISSSVSKLAEVEKVALDQFKIIYEMLDSLDKLLHTKSTETILGKAAVAAQFKIGPDKIAGCKCTEGVITKSDTVRLMRGEAIIGQSRIKSLRTGKTEVETVKTGLEFGAILSPFLDFKIGDSIIAFTGHA